MELRAGNLLAVHRHIRIGMVLRNSERHRVQLPAFARVQHHWNRRKRIEPRRCHQKAVLSSCQLPRHEPALGIREDLTILPMPGYTQQQLGPGDQGAGGIDHPAAHAGIRPRKLGHLPGHTRRRRVLCRGRMGSAKQGEHPTKEHSGRQRPASQRKNTSSYLHPHVQGPLGSLTPPASHRRTATLTGRPILCFLDQARSAIPWMRHRLPQQQHGP